MKKHEMITIKDLEVKLEFERMPLQPHAPYAVKITATCGKERREHVVTFDATKHDRTLDDIQKELSDAAQRLAVQCIGHSNANAALDEFFAKT